MLSSMEEIEEIVAIVAKREGLSGFEMDSKAGSIKGDNYLSMINTATLKGKDKNGEVKTVNLVLKTALKGQALRDSFPLRDIFEREIYFYDTIIPRFVKFQNERNSKDAFKEVPKMYYTSKDDKRETIVMENLREAGFSLWDRKVPMNPEHVKEVFRAYGKFHATSLAVRGQDEESFKELAGNLFNLFADRSEESLQNGQKELTKAMELFDAEKEASIRERLEGSRDSLRSILMELQNYKGDHGVVNHGDCWCNNFVFKYEDKLQPKKPTDIRILDFQMIRLGNPVFDLIHFLYTSTDHEVYDHYEEYLRVYHGYLSDHLKALGSDPELLRFDTLKEYWQKYSIFGLYLAPMMLRVVMSESSEAVDLQTSSESGKNIFEAFDYQIGCQDAYQERVRRLVLHFVKNNFI